jgi:hypothetical protein
MTPMIMTKAIRLLSAVLARCGSDTRPGATVTPAGRAPRRTGA